MKKIKGIVLTQTDNMNGTLVVFSTEFMQGLHKTKVPLTSNVGNKPDVIGHCVLYYNKKKEHIYMRGTINDDRLINKISWKTFLESYLSGCCIAIKPNKSIQNSNVISSGKIQYVYFDHKENNLPRESGQIFNDMSY